MKFSIGDWVQGHTSQGEMIHGFIEGVDVLQGMVDIYVVNSDHDVAVGQISVLNESDVKKLSMTSLENESFLSNMIDLALSTKDEAWFKQLTEQLLQVKQRNSARFGNEAAILSVNHNRLGLSGTR